jgi:hypothetical protein
MPKALLVFVLVVLGFNALALAFFVLRARRRIYWHVIYRDGFRSDPLIESDALYLFNRHPDAVCIESEFGRRVTPRRSAPGGFPAIK